MSTVRVKYISQLQSPSCSFLYENTAGFIFMPVWNKGYNSLLFLLFDVCMHKYAVKELWLLWMLSD